MRNTEQQYDVGVIVGRFQVHELHDGHKELIDHVCSKHSKVVIFLGLSPLVNTMNNPLDFESRRQMLAAEYPDINVLYIKDVNNDAAWSRKLDSMVGDVVSATQSVLLYGSRESFIPHYSGRYDTRELVAENESYFSGTLVRKEIARSSARNSADFRAGAIWASTARFPVAYCTVDVAIFDRYRVGQPSFDGTRILLGRKPHEGQFRFIGGFSDPASPSLEADVRREVHEEAGIAITDPKYVGSAVVDDWRYRNERDCIKTTLWLAYFQSGRPVAGDDIEEVRWFDFGDLHNSDIVPIHRPLLEMIRSFKEVTPC